LLLVFLSWTNKRIIIVGVTWPRLRSLSGKIICAPARHCPCKGAYQIWSL